jgi:hypothetical protein
VQEVEQVVGIRSGHIKANSEGHGVVSPDDALESLVQQSVASGGLGESQFVGGGLKIVAEEDGVMAVAGGIDADTKASGRLRSGSVLW